MLGWHGTKTKSAQRAASSAADSECGAVSSTRTPVAISRAWATTLGEPGRLNRLDVRKRLGPGVVPFRGRGLRIEIEHEHVLAALPEGGCEVQGDRRLSATALLVDECDCSHGRSLTWPHVDM